MRLTHLPRPSVLQTQDWEFPERCFSLSSREEK